MKKVGFLIIWFIILSISGISSSPKTANTNNALHHKIETYLNKLASFGFCGAVLVEKDGEKIVSNGWGFSNRDLQIKNSQHTVFDIGSVTKQFTAAAILKLEMQGKLSVDDKISGYFNDIPKDKQSITIHNLLTHTAGLPEAIGDDYEAITEDQFIEKVFNTPLISPVGKAYHYSNVGYSLLALIIEKVSNTSYEKYLSDNLFLPAGMNKTGYTLPKWDDNEIAVGYHNDIAWGKPTEKNWSATGPYLHLKGNGGILSTVEDLYKWHLALLKNDILSTAAKQKYYKPYTREGVGAPSFYGYGWAIFPTPRNTHLITHNGGNGIFFADFWRYLDEKVTIIVMTNNANTYSEAIASQVARIVFDPTFEPQIPSGQARRIDEAVLNRYITETVSTIRDGAENDWAEYIAKYGAEDFIQAVSMKNHLKFFKKFSTKIAGGDIQHAALQDDELIITIKTENDELNLILNIEFADDNAVKFSGIMLK